MPLFWFLAGVLTTLASLVVISPWLRKMPSLRSLPAAPWAVSVGAVATGVAIFGWYGWFGHSNAAVQSGAPPASQVSDQTAGAFGSAAKVFSDATSGSGDTAGESGNPASPATKPVAGSMNSAIASLESRLAKGSGSTDDWELLAKSFEFLGRPADAARARARQLPAVPMDSDSATAPAAAAPRGSGIAVSGEITLAPSLLSKAAAGETLFIVAKSAEAPGIPVAVFRASVGAWPLKFTLDDSQSMLPGRNLSSAGRVTIEARISQKGQPLPAAGDLQGTSGVIDPADHQSLKIQIDRVIQ